VERPAPAPPAHAFVTTVHVSHATRRRVHLHITALSTQLLRVLQALRLQEVALAQDDERRGMQHAAAEQGRGVVMAAGAGVWKVQADEVEHGGGLGGGGGQERIGVEGYNAEWYRACLGFICVAEEGYGKGGGRGEPEANPRSARAGRRT
jgi:hypothetical protein